MWFQPTDCGEGKECDHGSCARLHGEIAVKPKIYYIIPFQRHATCNEVQLDFTPEISGQPKGLSFGFRPKFSVSVGAETFRQNFPFGQKTSYNFGRNTAILAEILLHFRPKEFSLGSFGFRPKLRILDCPLSVSAETLSVDHYRKWKYYTCCLRDVILKKK